MRLILCLLLLFTISSTKAVETVVGGSPTYNTNNNISSSLPSWTNAGSWGSGNTNTGWNYVGQVNGASGTYLGNGWVLTAGHVGAGNFTLSGNTYDATGVSYTSFTYNGYIADLTLFRISTTSTTSNTLSLADLTLATNGPTAFSSFQSGSQNVMIGYGGGSESWGINTVTTSPYPTLIPINTFNSVDYETSYGATSNGSSSITNNSLLVVGDSGGANFVTNASGSWQLSGINEAVDTSNSNSYLVNLSYYASQIEAITAVPEPGTWAFMGLSAVALLGSSLWKRRRRDS